MRPARILALIASIVLITAATNIYWLFEDMGEAKGRVSILWNNPPPPQLRDDTDKAIVISWAQQNHIPSSFDADQHELKLILEERPLKGLHILCSGWNIIAAVRFNQEQKIQFRYFYAEAICLGH